MSLAVVYSRALTGLVAPLVSVEVHLSGGLPGMSIVGLPETAVKEIVSNKNERERIERVLFPRQTIGICSILPGQKTDFSLPWH